MGLRIDEHEIDYGFAKNMEEAISYVGSASNKLNNLYIPTEFVYYKSLINMKARIEEYKNRIKKFEKSIFDYIGYVKEAERANQNIIDSLTTGNLWGPMMANGAQSSVDVAKSNLLGTDWNSYMKWVNAQAQKVDITKLDFYLGSKVSVKSGTKYTEDSMGNGDYGIIGKTDGRPEGEYFADRAALYYNGHLIANLEDDGTNIEEYIKSYAKENNCNENEIKAVMHIATGENHEGATGWVDMSQMSYEDFKNNRTKYQQGISEEIIEKESKTIANEMVSAIAAGITYASNTGASSNKNSKEGNNNKNNSKNSENKEKKDDIDISSIIAGLGNFDGNIVYSDDFIGPRAPMEIIKINNKIQNMKNQIGLLEKTSKWLQVEFDEKYGKRLQELDEKIEAKKKALNETYDTLETVDIGTNLKISKELEELYKERSKITNNEEYKSLVADLAEINYSIEMMRQELPFQKYYAIEENVDFQNYKADSRRIELTNKELWYTGGSGGLYFTEYEKYNPLLIAEQVYNNVGNSTAYGSNGPLYRDVLMAEAGEGAQYLSAYTYMTQEQRNMYNYLFDKKGYKEAEEYLKILRNSNYWQMQRGQYEAQTFLDDLEYEKDENGNKVCTKNSVSNILNVFEEGSFQGIEGFQEGLENLFISEASEMTYTQYKQLIIAEYLSENSGVLDKTYDFGQVYGNMVVPRLIGTLIPVPGFSAALVGASATGNAKQQALQGGYDLDKAWTYGIMSGLSEATLEHFLGTIPGVRSTKVASKLARAGNLGAFCKFGLDVVGEGMEEGLQEYVDAGLRAAILGEEIDLSGVNEQALESFLMGAAMGGFSNVTAPMSCVINNQHIQIDKIDTETIESLIEEIERSQKNTKSNKVSDNNKVTEESKENEVSNKTTLREKALTTAENLRKVSEKKLEKLKTSEKNDDVIKKLTEAQEKLRAVEEEYKEKQKNYKPNEKIDITDYQNKLNAIVNEAIEEYNSSHIETDKRKIRRNKRNEAKKDSTKNQTKINDIKDDVSVDVKSEGDSTQNVNRYEIAEEVHDIELNVDNDMDSDDIEVKDNTNDINSDAVKVENNNDDVNSDTMKVEDNTDDINSDAMKVENNTNDVNSDTTKVENSNDVEQIKINNMPEEEFFRSISEKISDESYEKTIREVLSEISKVKIKELNVNKIAIDKSKGEIIMECKECSIDKIVIDKNKGNVRIESKEFSTDNISISDDMKYIIFMSKSNEDTSKSDSRTTETWTLEYKDTNIEDIEEKQNIKNIDVETKDQLNKALDLVKDTNARTQILELIDKYISEYNEQLEYLGTGQSATVFEIGPVVLKFGANRRYDSIPLCLDNIYTLEYDPKYNTSFRVMNKLDTEGITEADTQYVYNQLRENGYVWYDPKPENIGRLPDGGSDIDSLRIIDDVDIESEKEFEKTERLMLDGKISVMERMAKADIDKLKYEINYQKSINPNFDIEDLGSYFKDYDENPWIKDTIDEYVKTYKKQVEVEELNNKQEKVVEKNKKVESLATESKVKSNIDRAKKQIRIIDRKILSASNKSEKNSLIKEKKVYQDKIVRMEKILLELEKIKKRSNDAYDIDNWTIQELIDNVKGQYNEKFFQLKHNQQINIIKKNINKIRIKRLFLSITKKNTNTIGKLLNSEKAKLEVLKKLENPEYNVMEDKRTLSNIKDSNFIKNILSVTSTDIREKMIIMEKANFSIKEIIDYVYNNQNSKDRRKITERLERLYSKNNSILETINLDLLKDDYIFETFSDEQLIRITHYKDVQDFIMKYSGNIAMKALITEQLRDNPAWISAMDAMMRNVNSGDIEINRAINIAAKANPEDITNTFLNNLYDIIINRNIFFEIKDINSINEYDKKSKKVYWEMLNGQFENVPTRIRDRTTGFKYAHALTEYLYGISFGQALNILYRNKGIKNMPKGKDATNFIENIEFLEKHAFDSEDTLLKDLITKKIRDGEIKEDDYRVGNCYGVYAIENDIRDTFVKQINDTLYTPNKEDLIRDGECTYKGKNIAVYNAPYVFNMLVRLEGAYNPNQNQIDDYREYFNMPTIEYHGNCESYIGNDSISVARTRNDAVCFGYSNLGTNELIAGAPTDMVSNVYNGLFNASINKESNLMSPVDLIANTRHNHNEIVQERLIINEDGIAEKLKPNYVIWIEEYTAEQKKGWNQNMRQKYNRKFEEAKKAAAQLDIPIVKIDKPKYIKMEFDKVSLMEKVLSGKNITDIIEKIDCNKYNMSPVEKERYINMLTDEIQRYEEMSYGEQISEIITKFENNATGLQNDEGKYFNQTQRNKMIQKIKNNIEKIEDPIQKEEALKALESTAEREYKNQEGERYRKHGNLCYSYYKYVYKWAKSELNSNIK